MKPPLIFEFDIEEQTMLQFMTKKRHGDRIPKAMKIILPAIMTKPTRTIVNHGLRLSSLLTTNLTDTHESLCSAANTTD